MSRSGAGGVGRLVSDASDSSQHVLLESPLIAAFDVLSAEGELLAAGADGVHRLDYRFADDVDRGELLGHERLLEDYYAYRLTRSRFRPVIYAEMESSLALLVPLFWLLMPLMQFCLEAADKTRITRTDSEVSPIRIGRALRLAGGAGIAIIEFLYIAVGLGDHVVKATARAPGPAARATR